MQGARVLIVGVGGLGCPVAMVLAQAGIGQLVLVDDDEVDVSNLHRQVLFESTDVGRHKLDAARDGLVRRGVDPARVVLKKTRLLPENARALVRDVDLVVEGADNFATKFLAADACHLERRPIVHGAGVRWQTTAWCVDPAGTPCYRCLFEDVPLGNAAPNCAEAGVMAPVVGIGGALMAELALRYLAGQPSTRHLFSYDGKSDRLREVPVSARPTCPLCGPKATIDEIIETRYIEGLCEPGGEPNHGRHGQNSHATSHAHGR